MLLDRVPGQPSDALVDHADGRAGVRVYAVRHPSTHYPGNHCAVSGARWRGCRRSPRQQREGTLWEPIAFER